MAFPRQSFPGSRSPAAGHGRPVPRSSGFLRRTALIGVAAAGLVVTPLPAHAGDPATSADAAVLLAAKGHELEVLTEQFDTAREQLGATQATAREAALAVDRAKQELIGVQARIRGVARSAYTGGNRGALQAFLTSSSADEFIDRVSTLNSIAGRQNQVLAQAASAQEAAARARVLADQSTGAARTQYQAVLKQQVALQQQISTYRAEFDRLSAAEQRAAQEAASHTDPRASRGDRVTDAAPSTATVTAPVVGGSDAVQKIITTALAQRGKPYVWAAAGPASFDCSGLVQYAFRAAGVSLPHSSNMQSQMGRPVSRSEARAGDLVFLYTPVSHIGIYLGNGLQVHAPTSGDVVKIASVDGFGEAPRFTRIVG